VIGWHPWTSVFVLRREGIASADTTELGSVCLRTGSDRHGHAEGAEGKQHSGKRKTHVRIEREVQVLPELGDRGATPVVEHVEVDPTFVLRDTQRETQQLI